MEDSTLKYQKSISVKSKLRKEDRTETSNVTRDDSPQNQNKINKNIHSANPLGGVLVGWLCVMCQLLRPHNIPLVLLTGVLEQLVCNVFTFLQVQPNIALTYYLWMSRAAFFFQVGNGNYNDMKLFLYVLQSNLDISRFW